MEKIKGISQIMEKIKGISQIIRGSEPNEHNETSRIEKFKKLVETDHIITMRGKIHIKNFDPECDEVLIMGEISDDISDDIFTAVMNKKNGTNYKVGEIARKPEDINKNTKYYEGDLDERHIDILKNGIGDNFRLAGSLKLSNLTSIEDKGITFPKVVDYTLDLRNLGFVGVNELRLPEVVGGDLNLQNLYDIYSCKNFIFPKVVGGSLNLQELNGVSHLILPKRIAGSVLLNNLQYVAKLIFPGIVEGYIDLRNLQSAKEKLILPSRCNGPILLNSFKSVDKLTLPDEFTAVCLGGDLKLKEAEDLYHRYPQHKDKILHYRMELFQKDTY